MKKNTHIVLKVSDIEKYLSKDQQNVLNNLFDTISHGREFDGKNAHNEYYLCNTDEPYAEQVLDLILSKGEINPTVIRSTNKEQISYLFRGLEPESRKWVYGHYYSSSDTTYCFKSDYENNPDNTHHYILFDEMTDWGLPNRHMRADILPDTLGRYSWKQDIDGHPIYEGDIIESHLGGQVLDVIMVVKYGTYKAYCPVDNQYMDNVGFYVAAKGYPDMPLGPTEEYAKIIGNVTHNPDLIDPELLNRTN